MINKQYTIAGPYEYEESGISNEALAKTRERALEYMREAKLFLRSCWVCNSAHVHLISEDDAVLECFGCGHYYLGGVDVTELEEA